MHLQTCSRHSRVDLSIDLETARPPQLHSSWAFKQKIDTEPMPVGGPITLYLFARHVHVATSPNELVHLPATNATPGGVSYENATLASYITPTWLRRNRALSSSRGHRSNLDSKLSTWTTRSIALEALDWHFGCSCRVVLCCAVLCSAVSRRTSKQLLASAYFRAQLQATSRPPAKRRHRRTTGQVGI